MKNAHGVEPTRFKKRRESDRAIGCCHFYGPYFGGGDIVNFFNNCNEENSCYINNDGTRGFECHPEYKSSLFVNTAGPNEKNCFSVIDYEVFRIENYNDYIYHICKHPDIIWEYIETKDISEELLKQFDDDTELLSDLDVIQCENNSIRLKMSRYYLKNHSEYLPDTQLVNQQYDAILREWTGDYKWRLIYRASEHGYTAYSFHECCNSVRGPTLIVIKSSGGWIFGGYTTQSWKLVYDEVYENCIYYDMK